MWRLVACWVVLRPQHRAMFLLLSVLYLVMWWPGAVAYSVLVVQFSNCSNIGCKWAYRATISQYSVLSVLLVVFWRSRVFSICTQYSVSVRLRFRYGHETKQRIGSVAAAWRQQGCAWVPDATAGWLHWLARPSSACLLYALAFRSIWGMCKAISDCRLSIRFSSLEIN